MIIQDIFISLSVFLSPRKSENINPCADRNSIGSSFTEDLLPSGWALHSDSITFCSIEPFFFPAETNRLDHAVIFSGQFRRKLARIAASSLLNTASGEG